MIDRDKKDLLKNSGRIASFVNGKYCPHIFAVSLMLYYLGYLTANKADYDLWGYLSFGKLFWENKGFPYYDVFSYMPTKTIWIYHEWLTGIIFFKIYQFIGMTGLQILRYSIGLTTVWLVYRCAIRHRAGYLAAFLALFLSCGLIISGYAPVRAQIFTYFFYALSIYILESARNDGRWGRLWWLVLIQLVWCNLHGGFVAGLFITGLYVLGEAISGKKFWPYAGALVFSTFITLINPYGIKYWGYIYEAITMHRPFINEWISFFTALKYKMFFYNNLLFMIMVFISLILIVWHRKRNITALLVLTVTALLGFKHIRHMVFFALSFGIHMPVIFTAVWESFNNNPEIKSRWDRLRIPGFTLFFLLFVYITVSSSLNFILGSPFEIKTPSRQDQQAKIFYYPVGAVNYIKTHMLKGNVLPEFQWGEYIMWTCYPDCRVGMDGRYETVYPDRICDEYFNFIYGKPGWRTFLNKYPHDMIITEPDSIVHKLIQNETGWQKAFEDKGSVLFVKKTS